MAEKKKETKKSKTKKTTKKESKKLNFEDLTLTEARKELQKLKMAIIEGRETDTSNVRKLKTHIARLLTNK